jgi:hypothetical protein
LVVEDVTGACADDAEGHNGGDYGDAQMDMTAPEGGSHDGEEDSAGQYLPGGQNDGGNSPRGEKAAGVDVPQGVAG